MTTKIEKVNYEDALNMTGFGKFNVLIVGLSCSIISAMVFELYSVSYIVPASACELLTTSAQQGLMAGLPLGGVVATSHLWGYLGDKYGRRKMLCFSMVVGFIAGSLAALSPSWIVLCVLKFMSSAAVSGASALALALLGECSPHKNRAAVLLLTTSAFLMSSGIMAVISIPVLPLKFSFYIPILDIHFNSWRLLNIIFSLPCALCAIGAICSCESPKYLLSVGKEEETMKILKMIYVMNGGKSEESYQVNSVVLGEDSASDSGQGFFKSIVVQSLPLFRAPLLKGTLLLSVLFVMVFICVNSFIIWVPFIIDAFMSSVESGATGLTICQMIRLSKNNSATVEEPQTCTMNNTAMMMVLFINMALAVLNVLAGLSINCFGKRRLYLGIQMLSGTAALFINISSIWILSALLLFTLMIDILNFGFLSSFCIDIFPTYVKAKAVCLMLMMGRGSTILGVNVLKQLIEYNCEVAFYIFGVMTICAGFLGLLLPADRSLFKKTK